MKVQFDAHLPHQTTAIDAVLGLFEGSEAADSRDVATAFQTFDTELFRGTVQTPMGVGNAGLEREGLLRRIRAVQEHNGIETSPTPLRQASSSSSPTAACSPPAMNSAARMTTSCGSKSATRCGSMPSG